MAQMSSGTRTKHLLGDLPGCYMVLGLFEGVCKEDHLLILLKYQDQERINTFQVSSKLSYKDCG